MDVDAALYPRKSIERLGIAPLTSMFQCGENDRRMANDWRPEIHDSDGLSLLARQRRVDLAPAGESGRLRVNSYFDENPRGFGLLAARPQLRPLSGRRRLLSSAGRAFGWNRSYLSAVGARARCS